MGTQRQWLRTYDGTSRGLLAKNIATYIQSFMLIFKACPGMVSEMVKNFPAGGLAYIIDSIQASISTMSIRSVLKTSPSMR